MKTIKLEMLNSIIGDWIDRNEAIYKKYIKDKKTPHYKRMNVYALRHEIEKHIQLLLYKNLIKPFVVVYFQDNYFNLTTEIVKSYTGESILDLPFIEKLYKLTNNSIYNVIKEAYADAVCMSEFYLENFMLDTWHEVCNEIESQTLNLFSA